MTRNAKAPDLGAMIDKVWRLRAERLAAQKVIDKAEEEEKALKQVISETLREAKLEGAKGLTATAAFKRTTVAQVTDEDALLAWGKLKANRDCIKVGVVSEAWRLRLAEGVEVPGVESFFKVELSLTKAGA